MGYQIAIDGPAGAGKSTIAILVSEKLGFTYIDTGAMYRAIGLHFKNAGRWPETSEDITALAMGADIDIVFSDGRQKLYLNGKDVSEDIRTEEAGMLASKVSMYPEVRVRLVRIQQELASSADVVMDGRDIGTVVLPDADLKIFLTADVSERAKRRYRQLLDKGVKTDIKEIENDLRARDHQDSTRKASPLKQADDAVLLDTTHMTLDEVVEYVVNKARERM